MELYFFWSYFNSEKEIIILFFREVKLTPKLKIRCESYYNSNLTLNSTLFGVKFQFNSARRVKITPFSESFCRSSYNSPRGVIVM